MSKALEGVRILDLGHVQAAPTATQLLAWMGAEVIKVEMPGRGDITRGQLRDVKGADSLYFTMLNSNKRSITINLKAAGGKKILEELVRRCDVVVENFGPGVLDRQGFTWARFQELNPRIIYASIKGFGPGRYAAFTAYEDVAQCMGGASSTTGWAAGLGVALRARRPERLCLCHHPAALLGAADEDHRAAGADHRPGFCDAGGAAAAHPGVLLDHRALDADQDQVRCHGGAERGRYSVRPNPVDEGHL